MSLQFAADEETPGRDETPPWAKLLGPEDARALLCGDVTQSRRLESLECVLMSGSALGKELNTPEEDEAWAHFNQET